MRVQWIKFVFLLGIANIFFSYPVKAQCVEGNCSDGEGVYVYPSGAKFVGNFLNHLAHGFGILYFANGDIYEGMWNQHIREGNGKLIANGKFTYTGEFSENNFHGRGIIKYQNSDEYAGYFKNGKFNGEGVYITSDGERFEGKWSDGVPQNKLNKWNQINSISNLDESGMSTAKNCNLNYCHDEIGQFTYRDGTIYSGYFIEGSPQGLGRVQYVNGDIYEGGWKNHAPDGEGVVNYQSGRSYGAIWRNGIPVKELSAKNDFKNEVVALENSAETRIWAVIIGVSRYHHMPSLKYTDDDAFHLYAFLKSPEGGAIPENQISLLIDEQANREEIVRRIQRTFLKADSNDMVMLYFSGHGLPGRIIPNDFDGYYNAVDYKEIKQILDKSQARHKLIIADACHSGSLIASKTPLTDQINGFYNQLSIAKNGIAMITSSKGEEVSMESTGLRHGIFSHFLIEGIGGAADTNADQIITITELFNYIDHHVTTYTNREQNPMISGSYDPNMPIGFVRHQP